MKSNNNNQDVNFISISAYKEKRSAQRQKEKKERNYPEHTLHAEFFFRIREIWTHAIGCMDTLSSSQQFRVAFWIHIIDFFLSYTLCYLLDSFMWVYAYTYIYGVMYFVCVGSCECVCALFFILQSALLLVIFLKPFFFICCFGLFKYMNNA